MFIKFKSSTLTLLIACVIFALFSACKASKKDNSSENKESLEQAQKEIAKADQYKNKTDALVIYENVANKYDNSIGNDAKLYAAQILYEQGKYSEAQKYLEEYSPTREIPGSQILLGDTYMKLEKYDQAVKAYDQAIDLAKKSFWERISWREITLFLLTLAAITAIVIFARKKDNPKLRRLVIIISAVIFLGAAGTLVFMLRPNPFENRFYITAAAMNKKAEALEAQGKYDEAIKIYKELEENDNYRYVGGNQDCNKKIK